MASETNIWYRIGYAFERARPEAPPASLKGLAERLPDGSGGKVVGKRASRPEEADEEKGEEGGALALLLTTGRGALAARLLSLWPRRHEPGAGRLVRAALAGAGAAVLTELVRPLLRDDEELPPAPVEVGRALLSGSVRGLVYGALLEPRLPGPAFARGAVFGTVEYLASPWGGLESVLGKAAPHRRIPLLSSLLGELDGREDHYTEHLVYGVALALLAGTEEVTVGATDEDSEG